MAARRELEGLMFKPGFIGRSGPRSVSIVAQAQSDDSDTLAWGDAGNPSDRVAGNAAIFIDVSRTVKLSASLVTPTGFTLGASGDDGSGSHVWGISSKILTGSESGNIIGMNGGGGAFTDKILLIVRGDKPITEVVFKAAPWNFTGITSSSISHSVDVSSGVPSPLMVLAVGCDWENRDPDFDAWTGTKDGDFGEDYAKAGWAFTPDAYTIRKTDDGSSNELISGYVYFR
jgi:hypothetical protein